MNRLGPAFALAFAAVTLSTAPSLAQSPRPTDDPPVIIDRDDRPKSKSDATRVVGKVLEIDRQKGTVKLQAEEGVVTAKPTAELLRAARVGDTISVPRAENQPPNASPRTR